MNSKEMTVDEWVLKWLSLLLVILTIGGCYILYLYPQAVEETVEDTVFAQDSEPEAVSAFAGQEVEEVPDNLTLTLPKGVEQSQVEIINDYRKKEVILQIPTRCTDYFSTYGAEGDSDHILSLSYALQNRLGIITIQMDGIYEPQASYANGQLTLSFCNPREIYDKIVVIDAGHGDSAVGATRRGIFEKDINLAIMEELKTLFEENPGKIGVYYTREDDSNPSLADRVGLANELGADLFISIHNNSSGNGSFTRQNGTQVMYSQSAEGGEDLANLMLSEVTEELGSKAVGTLEGDHIYIIRYSQVPVALVEVGFMTNRQELDDLTDPDYQKKAAQGIYNGIQAALYGEEGK